MKGLFWPLLLIAVALGTAAVWHFTPLFTGTDGALSEAVAAPVAVTPAPVVGPVSAAKSAGEANPAVGKKSPPASAAKTKSAKDASQAVPRTKENPTGSPWLEPAARLLREYRRETAELERNRDRMGMAEQRAKMKKLHYMRERLEFLNARHRAWKSAHPTP